MRRKKTAALILAVMLAIACFPAPALAADDAQLSSMVQLVGVMGIMSGYPDGSFGGYDTLTRAQFAKILTAASPYKSLVAEAERSSPFLDVPHTHWGSAYIKVAAQKKLLYGYPDGSYKPEQTVKTEEVVTAALRLLGYSDSDFGASWPSGQMSAARSMGLLNGVGAVGGYSINRYDTMRIIYNLLSTKTKDGTQHYAKSLGYTMNGDTIDLAAAITQNMSGPLTAVGSWYSQAGLTPSSMVVYRDGERTGYSAVAQYDIVYYNRESNMVWCYSQKVTGTLDKILPNQDAPTSVTVAGNSYELESITAYSKVATQGSFREGDTVTVLLGKDKKAADLIPSGASYAETSGYGCLIAAGQRYFTDTLGRSYMGYYAVVATIDGGRLEFETAVNYSSIVGGIVKVSTAEGKAALSRVSRPLEGSGIFDWDNLKMGSHKLSKTVKIMDIGRFEVGRTAKYTLLHPQRIANVRIDPSKVAYYVFDANNEICELYLHNLTNDMYEFGIVSGTTSSTADNVTTYRHTIQTAKAEYTYSTTSADVYTPYTPLLVDADGTAIKNLTRLTPISGEITAVYASYIETADKNYRFADDALIYKEFNGVKSITEASRIDEDLPRLDIFAYIDKNVEEGGRVRILMASPKEKD